MEQPIPPQEPLQPHPTAESPESSIFQESDYSMAGYDKHIRNARNMLFIVAGVQLVAGFFSVKDQEEPGKTISIAIVVGVALIFAGLAFWTKKKPFAALLTALILYGSLLILDAIFEPSSIIKGIILKVAIIVSLISGIRNAKEAEDLKKAFGKDQE
jgi:UDP-N-acetylmuramyl pentapeptide phosphotransferase/UDP-N-acetylglucosamine-1-phosphate transferase